MAQWARMQELDVFWSHALALSTVELDLDLVANTHHAGGADLVEHQTVDRRTGLICRQAVVNSC
jgi:hypothetical protein